jgi:hypothetical protein
MTRCALLILLGLLALVRPAAAQPALCHAAIQAAEAEFSVPPGLLMAIARVESGRRDPETGRVEPWPWTINAEGRGSFFPSLEAAVAGVRAALAQGIRSIDTGCMQVNMRAHPDAFSSIEQSFDPAANARYAARFLTALKERAGSWEVAAGHYHSQTPERAEGYRARVLAAWEMERRNPTAMAAAQPAPAAPRAQGPAAAFSFANGAEQAAVLPAQPGQGQGRGLDAYRAAPIAVAGRSLAMPVATPAVRAPVSRRLF